MKKLVALVVLALALATVCEAKPNPFMAELDNFNIVVDVANDMRDAGISEESLITYAKLYCMRNSLPYSDETYGGYLYINVSGLSVTIGGEKVGYSPNVRLELCQPALTRESKELYFTVTSWFTPMTFGTTDGESLKEFIESALKDQLRQFEMAWRENHPKK